MLRSLSCALRSRLTLGGLLVGHGAQKLFGALGARYSLDRALGIRVPGVIVAGTLVRVAALGLGVARLLLPARRQEQAGAQAPAGLEATASGSTDGRS